MGLQKKICLLFLGNPINDSRLTNLSDSLTADGCEVRLIGFDWFPNAHTFKSEGMIVYKLERRPSLIFYLRFFFFSLIELIRYRADIYFAEDFYSLLITAPVAKIRGAKLYYNSREIYAFIGGLARRPILQKFITALERIFIRFPDLVLTTGEMDSDFLERFYSISTTLVIRNIPLYQKPSQKIDLRKMYGIPDDKLIMIYQGIITEGRGIAFILEAMKKLPDVFFVLIGEGQKKNFYAQMAQQLGVENRVVFTGQVEQRELINYTSAGDIGLSLIENISVSYYHALPNKLFEYIMAGLPVLSSNLPQMKKIIDDYGVGECIELKSAGEIADIVKLWTGDGELLKKYRSNCETASRELNWQEEYKRAKSILLELPA